MTEAKQNYMYYFDVLPLHPRLEPGESLSSFLIRLAEANGIKQRADLAALIAQGNSDLMSRNPDFPLPTLVDLQAVSDLDEDVLMSATFANLGKKFINPLTSDRLERFLFGSLRRDLCFCPMCVKHFGYYRLTWRFRVQFGCCVHQIALEERCHRCNRRLPLFSPPYEIGICPTCGAQFAEMDTNELGAEAAEKCVALDDALTYLLAPQWWDEKMLYVMYHVRKYLALWRSAKGWCQSLIASKVGSDTAAIWATERYNFLQCGDNFKTYINYLNLLEHDIVDPFRQAEEEVRSGRPNWCEKRLKSYFLPPLPYRLKNGKYRGKVNWKRWLMLGY